MRKHVTQQLIESHLVEGRRPAEGIDAEVVDPRTLRPLDSASICESATKTGRCVIVEVGWPLAGVGAEIAFQVQRSCLDALDGPIERVCSDDVPMPYARNLEDEAAVWDMCSRDCDRLIAMKLRDRVLWPQLRLLAGSGLRHVASDLLPGALINVGCPTMLIVMTVGTVGSTRGAS